ncbi:MAG: hypothetical protein IPN01_09635 [Deltaproteobacteria bacterium]|nr:hypothetical protein [Deltaproteobacteria bacterium]
MEAASPIVQRSRGAVERRSAARVASAASSSAPCGDTKVSEVLSLIMLAAVITTSR